MNFKNLDKRQLLRLGFNFWNPYNGGHKLWINIDEKESIIIVLDFKTMDIILHDDLNSKDIIRKKDDFTTKRLKELYIGLTGKSLKEKIKDITIKYW